MIGKRIKEVRDKNKLTQTALAKRLNISRSAVNAWEMGISIPSAQYLIELSRLFKVSVDYLLDLTPQEVVDISFLAEDEKRIIYTLVDYFQKYGHTMRRLKGQIKENYDKINKMADTTDERAVKNILDEIIAVEEII